MDVIAASLRFLAMTNSLYIVCNAKDQLLRVGMAKKCKYKRKVDDCHVASLARNDKYVKLRGILVYALQKTKIKMRIQIK